MTPLTASMTPDTDLNTSFARVCANASISLCACFYNLHRAICLEEEVGQESNYSAALEAINHYGQSGSADLDSGSTSVAAFATENAEVGEGLSAGLGLIDCTLKMLADLDDLDDLDDATGLTPSSLLEMIELFGMYGLFEPTRLTQKQMEDLIKVRKVLLLLDPPEEEN